MVDPCCQSLTFNDCSIKKAKLFKSINRLYVQDLMITETVTVIPFDTITKYQNNPN
jgi:hypothetical protein